MSAPQTELPGLQARASAPSTGLVLAGAAALGAYEVGVIDHVINGVLPQVGCAIPEVLAGTSAGAINSTMLAAFADDPRAGVELLTRSWTELRLGQILRPSSLELLAMVLDVAGAPTRLRRALAIRRVRGGLLDARQLRTIVERAPLDRIDDHLRDGRLRGVTMSATRVSNGTPVVFYQAARPSRPWVTASGIAPLETTLTADHVLASAAIPLLFPPVEIDGAAYCDGGLRQMVPLSPAIHLGADRLLVVNPLPSTRPAIPDGLSATSPLYLAGKALNALFADRVDADLARLEHLSAIVRAGQRRFGAGFAHELNLELGRSGANELRPIDAVCIEPTEDLGKLAAAHVASPSFARWNQGPFAHLIARIAGSDPDRMGDLLSYVLFDGAFTAKLIELGRGDARARHDALCTLLAAPGLDVAAASAEA